MSYRYTPSRAPALHSSSFDDGPVYGSLSPPLSATTPPNSNRNRQYPHSNPPTPSHYQRESNNSNSINSNGGGSASSSMVGTSRSTHGGSTIPGSGGRHKSSETINLNHLLNFSMPARAPTTYGGSSGGGGGRRSKGVRSQNGAYLREKYVNSQFRFVMKPEGNYAAHLADPDVFFNWPSILQVIVPTLSALSQAQGDDDPSIPMSSSYHELDRAESAQRRLRREKEKEGMTCPICLGKPVAGRITKCGHVFCFACILHYFQLSDIPKAAKCPICGDIILERMLKSIQWYEGENLPDAQVPIELPRNHTHPHQHSTHLPPGLEGIEHHDHGSDVVGPLEFDSASLSSAHRIRMRLIRRPHISTLSLPRSATWPSEAIPTTTSPPFHFLPDVMAFSKFCLATKDYMLEQLERDLRELDIEKRGMLKGGDDLGVVFVEAAERKVREQMEKARTELDVPLVRKQERAAKEAWKDIEDTKGEKATERRRREEKIEEAKRITQEAKEKLEDVPLMHLFSSGQQVHADSSLAESSATKGSAADDATTPTSTATPLPSFTPIITPSSPAKVKGNRRNNMAATATSPLFTTDEPCYFFYQAASGANIYLHPLDIKILLSHYKSYNAFPDYITIRPEGSDEGTINEELRRRCKYLGHLSLGTDVVFVEADLEDTLGLEAVAPFETALKQRRNRRREKVKKEDKAKSRWEAKEREKLPFSARNSPGHSFNGEGDSEEFLAALERSTLEAGPSLSDLASSPGNSHLSAGTASFPPSTLVQASSSRLSPAIVNSEGGNSLPGAAGAWGSSNGGTRSFASALHSTAEHGSGPIRPVKKAETDWEMEQAWMAFEESATQRDEIGALTKGGGKKSKKKVVLSMSSGGRRG